MQTGHRVKFQDAQSTVPDAKNQNQNKKNTKLVQNKPKI